MSSPPARRELEPRVQAARGKVRVRPAPDQVEPVGAGEESVWRFPRPPRVERLSALVEIATVAGLPVARSERALRVLETASPPVVYVPPEDLAEGVRLHKRADWALCEWKGVSVYFDLTVGDTTVEKAGWRFVEPFDDLGQPYPRLKGWVAVFPRRFSCRLDGRTVRPQPGDYYGGWIDATLRGPFKGEPGAEDW